MCIHFFFGERRKFASVQQQQQVLVRMRQKTQNFFSSFAFALHCSGINSRRSRICGRTLLFHTLLSVWLGDDWNVSSLLLAFFGKPDGGEFLWLHDNFSSALMHFWCFYVSTHHIQMYADETLGSWIARWSHRDCDMLRKFSAVVHRLILFSLCFFCGNNFGWHLFYSVYFLCEVLLVLTRRVAGNPTSTTRPLDVCEFFFWAYNVLCVSCVSSVCEYWYFWYFIRTPQVSNLHLFSLSLHWVFSDWKKVYCVGSRRVFSALSSPAVSRRLSILIVNYTHRRQNIA